MVLLSLSQEHRLLPAKYVRPVGVALSKRSDALSLFLSCHISLYHVDSKHAVSCIDCHSGVAITTAVFKRQPQAYKAPINELHLVQIS
jgi:hypothetical protein